MAATDALPKIGKFRKASRLRKDWATLHTTETGTEWRTISRVLQFTSPLRVTVVTYTDGSERRLDPGAEFFTRTPAEAERAAKKREA